MRSRGSDTLTTERFSHDAQALRSDRAALARRLADLVADWPKYAKTYADNPDGFAMTESAALVDYMAFILDGSDAETFFNLYLGEKAKQFHDESVDDAERRHRIATVLAGEKSAFLAAVSDVRAQQTIERCFDRMQQTLDSATNANIDVLFIGDCLYLDVVSFLIGQAVDDGITIRPTFVTDHSAVGQRSALAKLVDRRFGAIFYSPFTYGFDDGYANLQRTRSALRPKLVADTIALAGDRASETLSAIVDLFDAPVFAHDAAPVFRREHTKGDDARAVITAPARHLAAKRLSKRIQGEVARHAAAGARIHLIDENRLAATVGLRHASTLYYRTELQHPARFGALVANHYRDIVFVCARLLGRKTLVCDLDNTLWDGVIGEGLGVRHYRDRQNTALKLKARGVVLAINSKNDPNKISWDGPDCMLTADDFVSRQINWDPKVVNMRAISKHLNLKEKDFVFIDDRADERSMVDAAFPGILTLDALAERSWKLLDLWAALLPVTPNADRTDFYRQRDARMTFLAKEEQSGQEERAAALASLDLRLSVRQATEGDLDRVTELINRTNQFNTTVARVTISQIKAISASADHRILIAEAGDRFGNMGVISVIIAKLTDAEAIISHFVLSCRVFGYGMEFAILDQLRRLLPRSSALSGVVIESAFNEPCRNVYRDAGFADDGAKWTLANASDAVIPVPNTLTVTGSAQPFDVLHPDRA